MYLRQTMVRIIRADAMMVRLMDIGVIGLVRFVEFVGLIAPVKSPPVLMG